MKLCSVEFARQTWPTIAAVAAPMQGSCCFVSPLQLPDKIVWSQDSNFTGDLLYWPPYPRDHVVSLLCQESRDIGELKLPLAAEGKVQLTGK